MGKRFIQVLEYEQRFCEHIYQPEGTANAKKSGLMGSCTVSTVGTSVGPKDGDELMPQIFGFISIFLAGVVGVSNDIGAVELEKLREGVLTVFVLADQDALEIVEVGINNPEDLEKAARLETNVVG